MSKYFITAIGNAIIDILAFIDDDYLAKEHLEKGSMTLMDREHAKKLANLNFEKVCSGGSAANTTVTLSNFGVKNAFIGNVGSGNYGDLFAQDLTKNNVDFYCKYKTDFGTTARSFILITPDGERTMCTYLGEASNITNEIDADAIANSEILYLEGYLWHDEAVKKALKKSIMIAKENNTKIAFTLSDAAWVNNHKQDFLKLAANVDIIFSNESEINALTSSEKLSSSRIKKLAQNNENLIIVITRSEKGAIIYNAKDQSFIKAPTSKLENIEDATGAGDAFAAGFLLGMNKNLSLLDCANIGNLFATAVIQKVGGRFEEKEIEEITQILRSESIDV